MSLGDLFGSRWTRRFNDMVQDLHTLEVNTIQKPGMTARRMPPVPTALAEISESYRNWLTRHYGAKGEAWANTSALDDAQRSELALVYRRFRECAHQPNRQKEFDHTAEFARLIEHHGYFGDAGDGKIICQRIWRNAAYLYSLVTEADNPTGGQSKRPITKINFNDWSGNQHSNNPPAAKSEKPTELSLYNLVWVRDEVLEKAWNVAFEDRAKVRKIWEVGTEQVLVQTAIQLEGDVITRISRKIAADDPGNVMRVHQQGIETAIGMWSNIIDAVIRFVEVLRNKSV